MLENFGLRVLEEHNYSLTGSEHEAVIQDFVLEARDLKRADFAALEPLFKEAFLAAWRLEISNDGFNRLLLCASLSAREIVLLRAYCRYLLQTGIPFSQAYMESVLVAQAPIARLLVRLFQTQFALDGKERERAAERIRQSIVRALDKVQSLDEDRILRAYLAVIRATLRTNYYQTVNGALKSWMSFKLDPQAIPNLPLPLPKFEIFVYSTRVEGVHLRMGYVARGGIRWSDRREDYRTEVLSLMKAQNVKNTVIVPVGAKGGFFPKTPASGRLARGHPKGRYRQLPGLHPRPARPHRQHRERQDGGACGHRAARWRRSVPGGRGRQGHRHLLRHRQRHLQSNTATG